MTNKLIYTKLMPMLIKEPLYLILLVSDKCWTYCRHCWYSDQSRIEQKNSSILTTDELLRIAMNIKRLNFLTISGGEAFLRDDLPEIINGFNTFSKISRFDIPTSGFDTDKVIQNTENILKLLDRKPLRVDVSIDGFESTHDFIRNRTGSFNNALYTLSELVKLKNKYKNLDVSVITTVSAFNQSEMPAFSDFITNVLNGNEWFINIIREPARDDSATKINPSIYYDLTEKIHDNIRNGLMTGETGHSYGKWLLAKNIVRRNIIYNIITTNNINFSCTAGTLNAVIHPDGTVSPCESLEDKIGNIRDYKYSLSNILKSKAAETLRNNIIGINCKCTHECFLSTNIISNPNLIRMLIKTRYFGL